MRGSIRPGKTKGTYVIILSVGKDPITGRYKQEWVTVRGTKKEAETKLAEILRLRDTGFNVKADKITLSEYLTRFLKESAKPNLSPRTYEGYESIVKTSLIPALGRVKLGELRPDHIQHYYSQKLESGRYDGKGGLNPSTVRHAAMFLHSALDTAVKWKLLPYNPADGATPPPMNHAEMHTLSEDSVHLFLEAAKDTPYYALYYLFLFSGMRRSEILALKWSDFNSLGMTLSVNKSIHRLHNGEFVIRKPKTNKGARLIPLAPSAIVVLREHKEKCIAQRMMQLSTLKEDNLIFCREDGSCLNPDVITHHFIWLARKIGLKDIRLHDLRHTFASLMLKNNVHPAVVQQMLGHASIQITIDTYSHIMPGIKEAAARSLDELLMTNPKKENIINITT